MKYLLASLLIPVLASLALAQTPPAWWSAAAHPVTNSDPRQDNAVATLGQAKHVVKQAYRYLNVALAEAGGAGPEVQALYDNFCLIAPADPSVDRCALTLGQLKYLAKPFYDRLNAVEIQFDTSMMNPATGLYPWSEEQADDMDTVAATLGQLKFCFSFDLSHWQAPRESFLEVWEPLITSIYLTRWGRPS